MLLKWGYGGLPQEKVFEAASSRMLENAFLQSRIQLCQSSVFMLRRRLIPQPRYTDISLLLLHVYNPMVEAEHSHTSRSKKDKACPPPPRYLAFAAWSALKRKKHTIPQTGCYVHIFAVGQPIQELKHQHFTL